MTEEDVRRIVREELAKVEAAKESEEEHWIRIDEDAYNDAMSDRIYGSDSNVE